MTQLEWHSPTSNATKSGYTLEHWSSINLVVPIVHFHWSSKMGRTHFSKTTIRLNKTIKGWYTFSLHLTVSAAQFFLFLLFQLQSVGLQWLCLSQEEPIQSNHRQNEIFILTFRLTY